MPNIGPLEIIIVLVIVLIIFGPKRLPDLGRSLGRGMREFKDSVTGKDKDDDPRELEASSTKVDAAEQRPADEHEPAQGARAGDAPS
jgi:sec-independent protein translocase protein TatA